MPHTYGTIFKLTSSHVPFSHCRSLLTNFPWSIGGRSFLSFCCCILLSTHFILFDFNGFALYLWLICNANEACLSVLPSFYKGNDYFRYVIWFGNHNTLLLPPRFDWHGGCRFTTFTSVCVCVCTRTWKNVFWPLLFFCVCAYCASIQKL